MEEVFPLLGIDGELGRRHIGLSSFILDSQSKYSIIFAPPAEQKYSRSKIQSQRHEEHRRDARS